MLHVTTGLQGAAETNAEYMIRIKGEMGAKKQHYGMRGPNKAAMPPMSWNQLEKDAGAVQKNATTGRSGRKGNGTRSTFSTNGEFNGSAKPTSSELQQLAGGTINPKRSQPRALFVSKDGSPVLTWNEIEQINMNDLNNALGSFNPGQQTRGKANGKKQKQFYGGKRGNGKVGRQEATTSLLSYKSNTGTEQQSPLQAKRPLKKGGRQQAGAQKPQAPTKGSGRRVKFAK